MGIIQFAFLLFFVLIYAVILGGLVMRLFGRSVAGPNGARRWNVFPASIPGAR